MQELRSQNGTQFSIMQHSFLNMQVSWAAVLDVSSLHLHRCISLTAVLVGVVKIASKTAPRCVNQNAMNGPLLSPVQLGFLFDSRKVPMTIFVSTTTRSLASVAWRTCRRWAHSNYAPSAVTAYLDMIRRHSDADIAKFKPNSTLDEYLACEDVQTALSNFERVVGVNRDDACEMLRHTSESYALGKWVSDSILPWKDIHRGKDLFLKGAGSFDVQSCCESILTKKRKSFATSVLSFFTLSFLREQCSLHLLPAAYASSDSHVGLIEALSTSSSLDIVSIITSAKFRNLTKSQRRKFGTHANFKGVCLQKAFAGTLCETDGGFSKPFWLLSVSELRCQGYFPNTGSFVDFDHESFSKIFSRSQQDSLQCRYMLQHRHYYDDPTKIKKFFDCVKNFEDSIWMKLDLTKFPQPEKLGGKLQSIKENKEFKHLMGLPDHGRFHVLRSRIAICQTGKKLRNCLGNDNHNDYISDVREKSSVLVCLDGADGKPFAVGKYALHRDDYNKWLDWCEIKGADNSPISPDTELEFIKYAHGFIIPWAKKVNYLEDDFDHDSDDDDYESDDDY